MPWKNRRIAKEYMYGCVYGQKHQLFHFLYFRGINLRMRVSHTRLYVCVCVYIWSFICVYAKWPQRIRVVGKCAQKKMAPKPKCICIAKLEHTHGTPTGSDQAARTPSDCCISPPTVARTWSGRIIYDSHDSIYISFDFLMGCTLYLSLSRGPLSALLIVSSLAPHRGYHRVVWNLNFISLDFFFCYRFVMNAPTGTQ